MTDDDSQLLRDFVRDHSEHAFARLVERHLPLVYGTALRRLAHDAHLARDVAQGVFIDLARKAGALQRCRSLAGWLHTSTIYAAAHAVRTEQRRRRREQQAHLMQELNEAPGNDAAWAAVRPVLDDALNRLNARDREAILLRYFGGRPFAEVGELLQVSENAARMRVDRALERLRDQLTRRGIVSTVAALGAALATQAAVVPPAGLAAASTGAAVGAAATTGGLTLFLNLIGMTKTQLALSSLVVAAGAITVGTQLSEQSALRAELARAAMLTASAGPAAAARAPSTTSPDADAAAIASAQERELAALEHERAILLARATVLRVRVAGAEEARRRRLGPPAGPPASAPSFDFAELDTLPQPSVQVPPQYPFAMKRVGIPGVVTLRLTIDETGAVTEAVALDSTHPEFTTSALEAVKQWQFAPGRKEGQAVRTNLVLPIQFQINNPSWF